MSFVRTVLGDVDAADLGVAYAHEHIIIDRSYATEINPHLLLDSVKAATQELNEVRSAGGRAMIDTMPASSGRNVLKLAEVSRRTKIHIVCPTGLHLQKYRPHGHWSERLTAKEIAALFIADIETGVDANDYNGATVERTAHRAGIIKIASGLNEINDFEQKVFEAAAIAHQATNAPIITHTEKGTAAIEQIELLQKFGVAPNRVVLSHTDRIADAAYHREILATGANLEYDGAFRWQNQTENGTLRLTVEMFDHGFGDQIMLGTDAARREFWKSYGGAPGLAALLTDFAARLCEAGLSQSDIETIFVKNPARAFGFAKSEF